MWCNVASTAWPFHTSIRASCPSRDGYAANQLLMPNAGTWMADAWIHGNVTLTLTFRQTVTVKAIALRTRGGRQSSVRNMQVSAARGASVADTRTRKSRRHSVGGERNIQLAQLHWPPQEQHQRWLVLSTAEDLPTLAQAQQQLPAAQFSTAENVLFVKARTLRPCRTRELYLTIGSMYERGVPTLCGLEVWAELTGWPAHLTAAAISATGESAPAVDSAPEERFLDAITQEVMRDPVRLPSGHCCDRYTDILAIQYIYMASTTFAQRSSHATTSGVTLLLYRHLERYGTDPFTGLTLHLEDITPDTALCAAIDAWRRCTTAKHAADTPTEDC